MRIIRTLLMSLVAAALLTLPTVNASAQSDPEDITIGYVGWTGVSIKTAIAEDILTSLGYDVDKKMVSVPIVYEAMSTGEADFFLGNWMPSMKTIAEKHFERGTVENLVTNMDGAKYTLAVPTYVAEAGVTNFADLDDNKDKFEGGKIYGIEEGNDGNQIIQDMIDKDMFGLGDWTLVPSSEPAMLSQVKSYTRSNKWIVFLGWAPHPMNSNIDMTYLDGSTSETFGANNGTARVNTNIRTGFDKEYPNATRFLKQFTFPISMMNEIMVMLDENDKLEPDEAAMKWLADHPDQYKGWLKGIKTRSGGNALMAWKSYMAKQ